MIKYKSSTNISNTNISASTVINNLIYLQTIFNSNFRICRSLWYYMYISKST